jgi:hypothetical protein
MRWIIGIVVTVALAILGYQYFGQAPIVPRASSAASTHPATQNAWQLVDKDFGRTDRMHVQDGWLYRSIIYTHAPYASSAVALVFVPDSTEVAR